MAGNVPLRVNRALVDTDAVVVVTAAETVVHGGPAALIAAAGPEAIRAAGAWSLLETAASQGWQIATTLERLLAARVPLIGVSLVLNHPQLVASSLRGFPYDEHVAERIAGSPFRRALAVVPGPLRARMIRSLRRDLTAAGVFAGPPAVAHAEALLRAIAAREVVLDEPLDAIVVGIPPTTLHLPRELPNPLNAAQLGLGVALKLWRDSFPVVDGGTAILVHPLRRRFHHPTQQPYRTFFAATRFGREPEELRAAEHAAVAGPARARRVPRRPHLPPPAPVCGLGVVPAGARPPRRGARRGLPRLGGGTATRSRPDPRPERGAGDGTRARRRQGADRRAARAAVLPDRQVVPDRTSSPR